MTLGIVRCLVTAFFCDFSNGVRFHRRLNFYSAKKLVSLLRTHGTSVHFAVLLCLPLFPIYVGLSELIGALYFAREP